jgi:hypothetical protein
MAVGETNQQLQAGGVKELIMTTVELKRKAK